MVEVREEQREKEELTFKKNGNKNCELLYMMRCDKSG